MHCETAGLGFLQLEATTSVLLLQEETPIKIMIQRTILLIVYFVLYVPKKKSETELILRIKTGRGKHTPQSCFVFGK